MTHGAKDVGPPADVYGLGAVLYGCLTGRPPVRAGTVQETLEQLRSRDPVPPRRLERGVPRNLETVCLKCLEKDPHRRYASAALVAACVVSAVALTAVTATYTVRLRAVDRANGGFRARLAETLLNQGLLRVGSDRAAAGVDFRRAEELLLPRGRRLGPRRGSGRRRRPPRVGVEYLEDRTMLSAGLPPDLVGGRTLSAYTVDRVVGNTLDVTYTVYNQTPDDLTGVLLTTSLQPGVTFRSSSSAADRSGQDVAWSLGTVPGFGRTSVTLTVTLPGPGPLQIDSGAKAFATRAAGLATADTPAAVLVNRVISADLLAATPGANTTDPFVREQAAKLRYDPQAIFDYLNTDVGYESCVGPLRGARGTLWSAAGNSLDEASLGLALFRASGIPARYAHGTLSDPLSKQLTLPMFPPRFRTAGHVPAGEAVAGPANDAQLLAETRDHYWVQFDSTAGFTNANSSGLAGGGIGTAFTTTSETFTGVADGLRHKVG